MPEPGTVIGGRYRILREIGRGGAGTVYLAVNDRADKLWAVKEIRQEGTYDLETFRHSLITETEVLKHLKHPQLPSVIDVVCEHDSLFIVMDYIEGTSLKDLLDKEGFQPDERVIEWGIQICNVLMYLHSRTLPVIYGDLKPSNIMLCPDGKLVLIDFGTARRLSKMRQDHAQCIGTPGYAAPEQFPGKGQPDERSDIFGLGATMYYMLTGKDPGSSYGMDQLNGCGSEISVGMAAIISKCMKTDPDERYQSAEALMYALLQISEAYGRFRTGQRKKLFMFTLSCVISIVFVMAGICFGVCASRLSYELYESGISKAVVTSDEKVKAQIYMDCISIPGKAADSKAYIGLISTYRDNDSKLDSNEAATLENLITDHKNELMTNISAYVDVCFEMGKTFWYYYDYGGADKGIAGAVNAAGWFGQAAEYSPEDYGNKGMAQVYAEAGSFYRDITANIIEGSDKGLYRPFFDRLCKLLEEVGDNEDENEAVRLQLFDLAAVTLEQYAAGFKNDGVPYSSMSDMITELKKLAEEIRVSTENNKNVRTYILNNVYKAGIYIDRMYASE